MVLLIFSGVLRFCCGFIQQYLELPFPVQRTLEWYLQIIELLAYALVLSGNHVFTSGAMGTNAATIRYANGLLRSVAAVSSVYECWDMVVSYQQG